MTEDPPLTPLIPPVGEDDPWTKLEAHSTREIVADSVGDTHNGVVVGGLRRFGHNPSWVKVSDVDAALTRTRQQHAEQIDALQVLEATRADQLMASQSREAARRAELAQEKKDSRFLRETLATLRKFYDIEPWNALQVARQEIETLKQEQAWQPIETAPKDGTPLIVHDEGAVMFAWWDEDAGAWMDHGPMDPPPQHWKPFPSAPVEQEKGTTTP